VMGGSWLGVLFCVSTLPVHHCHTQRNEKEETETMVPVAYRCGKDCGEDMGSIDPDADSMPHTFAPHIANATAKDMEKHMNANSKNANSKNAVPPLRFFPDQGLTEKQQIPYEAPGHIPAMRRPCNLDDVLKMLQQIKDDYRLASTEDSKFTTSGIVSDIAAAKEAYESAHATVLDLQRGKQDRETIQTHLATLEAKADLIKHTIMTKADLVEQEGKLKAPIVKTLNRIHVETRQTMALKQAALADFQNAPLKSEAEKTEVIQLYNKLLSNLKEQEVTAQKGSHDLLTPLQLDISQSDVQIDRLNTEVSEIEAEITRLMPTAQTYSSLAMSAAVAIEADAEAHYKSIVDAHQEYLRAHAKRDESKNENELRIEHMIASVRDVMMPQDPKDEYVQVTEEKPPQL